MKQSNFLSLNWLDLGKTLALAIIVTILHFLQDTFIPELNVSPEIKLLLITCVGYLIKNFFTKPAIVQKLSDSLDGDGAGTPDRPL